MQKELEKHIRNNNQPGAIPAQQKGFMRKNYFEGSIFERDFYPTPIEVIQRMLSNHDISNKIILEPSAGSGNIVDFLKKGAAKEVIACETNDKLRRIVASKCRIIASDFLKVTPEDIAHIDMIVMNPPFSNARKHILHAYEIAPSGCEIVALCNSSDIRSNRYYSTTDKERVNELIRDYGYSEDYGNCFKDSERATNVEVSCIHLYKPKQGTDEFQDYFFSQEEEQLSGSNMQGIVQYNVVRDVVARYVEAVKKFDSVQAANDEINELTSLFREARDNSILFGAYGTGECKGMKIDRQRFKIELQKQAWRYLINKLKLKKFATRGVIESINKFIEVQIQIPFTMKNIYQMVQMIIGTSGNRMNSALIEAFEHICSFSADNSTAGETWRTNSNYMVNKRFIVPRICPEKQYSFESSKPYVEIYYSSDTNRIDDIVKALCFITGEPYYDIDSNGNEYENSLKNFVSKNKLTWGQWYEWRFFKIRGYKKGTMHFEFKDEDIWMKFNMEVAKVKGWRIGSKTKK